MCDYEKKKLYSIFTDYEIKIFKKYKIVIAGGAITSLFCNSEINDIDIYFKSKTDCVDFIYDYVKENWITYYTDKALSFTSTNEKYKNEENRFFQLIMFDTYKTVQDIFDSFDFTVCMGAFDFETEEFILHKDFLKHNAQRILCFNEKTSFPLISALRLHKYKSKGYSFSRVTLIKIILTCMNLNIDNYEDMKKQLGGLYGEHVDNLIEVEGDFSITNVIEKLSNLDNNLYDYTMNSNKFKNNILDSDVMKSCNSTEDIINKVIFNYIGKQNFTYLIDDFKEKAYVFLQFFEESDVCNNNLDYSCLYPVEKKDIPLGVNTILLNDYLKIYFKKFYKFVRKREDELESVCRSSFKYKVNELIVAKKDNYFDGCIYCDVYKNVINSIYSNKPNVVLLEIEIEDVEDIIFSSNELIGEGIKGLTKGFVNRIVPEEEWKADANKSKETSKK